MGDLVWMSWIRRTVKEIVERLKGALKNSRERN